MRYIFLLTVLLGSSLTYNVVQHKRLREREGITVDRQNNVVHFSAKKSEPEEKVATKVESPPDELASMILSRLKDRTKWERYGRGIREVNGTLEMGWGSYHYYVKCDGREINSALSSEGWLAIKKEGAAMLDLIEKEEAEQLRREAIGTLGKK